MFVKKALAILGMSFSPFLLANIQINDVGPNFFNWQFENATTAQGNEILILFGPQPNIEKGAENIQKWIRAASEPQEVWLPESPNGNWYARVCDYNLTTDTCFSYSEEVVVSNPENPIPKNIGLSFTTIESDYIAWQLTDGDAVFSGEHIMLFFSETPELEQHGPEVNAWYRHRSDALEAWVGESPSGDGWYYRLCDYDLAKDHCNGFSETVFAGPVHEEPSEDEPEEPDQIDPDISGEFTITWISDGFISWAIDGLLADDIFVLFGEQPALNIGEPGTTVYGGGQENTGYSWLNGERYARLCHFSYEQESCVALSEVYDTFFPQLDNYPEHLPIMRVPMGTGQRLPSPYDSSTITENYPITDEEREASLPEIPEGTFASNPNLLPDNGRFYYECGISHIGYDDPIVFYGQPGVAHLHMFLGNQSTDAFTTTQSLLDATTPSTCRGNRLNRSAYWVPPVYDSHGNAYIPDSSEFMFVNYSTAVDPEHMQPFPEGFRMIAGNAMANAPQVSFASWRCSSMGGIYNSIPACPAGETLTMLLSFPQCWDGVNIDSANQQDHMAHPIFDATSGREVCPASHPVVLPGVTFDIRYDVHPELTGDTGDTRDWYLSSDMYDTDSLPGGYSIHGDFMNAWDEQTLQIIIDGCIKVPGGNCNNAQLPGDVELIQRVRGSQTMNPLP